MARTSLNRLYQALRRAPSESRRDEIVRFPDLANFLSIGDGSMPTYRDTGHPASLCAFSLEPIRRMSLPRLTLYIIPFFERRAGYGGFLNARRSEFR